MTDMLQHKRIQQQDEVHVNCESDKMLSKNKDKTTAQHARNVCFLRGAAIIANDRVLATLRLAAFIQPVITVHRECTHRYLYMRNNLQECALSVAVLTVRE